MFSFPLLLIWSAWSFSFARLILAISLIFHGWPKIKNIKGTAEWMSNNNFKPGIFWAIIVAILEFVGGIFLIFGFLVQLIALLLLIQFIIIIVWKIIKKENFSSIEIDLLILVIAFILLLNGGGQLALDNIF
ncbi:MAG: DoxX family protein [Patescibacteria group bacterium]|nr:DoxX family protein [Patescibacteria group bacterium]